MKKSLARVMGFLLAFVALLSIGSGCAKKVAPLTTYEFLNPIGTVEPRRDVPLAERSKVTDILYGTGARTLRLGVSWYYKPLDGEPAVALGQMLKEKWEKESKDPNNTQIPEGLTVRLTVGGVISNGLHPWNNKTDGTYDNWALNADAMIVGVGD
ncbi:MAG: hypothetical protein LBN00_03435 [Oscillospiraceae bacterium]|jgi:hypothetical protein|nr:hypothetical protein [Oscillospiraceae bacterium]